METDRCYYSHLIEQTKVLFNVKNSCILKFSIPSLRRVTQSEVCEGRRVTAGFIIILKLVLVFIKKALIIGLCSFNDYILET